IADRVVVVGGRVGLPDLDARLHQLAHRRLEVVVADDAARDPGGARSRAGLVEDDDVSAGPEPARAQLLGEVVRGRQAVDPGSDDDEARLRGKSHVSPPGQRYFQILYSSAGAEYSATTSERAAPSPRAPAASSRCRPCGSPRPRGRAPAAGTWCA